MEREERSYQNLRNYLNKRYSIFIRKDDMEDFIHDIILELLQNGIYEDWENNIEEMNKIADKIKMRYIREYKNEPDGKIIKVKISDEEKIISEIEVEQFLSKLSKYLSQRQMEVLQLTMDGYTQKEVAEQLNISPQRVNHILLNIKELIRKLGVDF